MRKFCTNNQIVQLVVNRGAPNLCIREWSLIIGWLELLFLHMIMKRAKNVSLHLDFILEIMTLPFHEANKK